MHPYFLRENYVYYNESVVVSDLIALCTLHFVRLMGTIGFDGDKSES